MKNKLLSILVLLTFAGILFSSCEDKYTDTKEAGEDYLKQNALSDTIQVLSDVIQYKVYYNNPYGVYINLLMVDKVNIKYTAYFIDGTVYKQDSKYYDYNQLPSGLQEVLRKMTTGSKWKAWIPQNLLYGSDGLEGTDGYLVDPYTSMIYDIELLGFTNE